MANSGMVKDAKDYIPFCADQGLPNLVGAASRGLSMQVLIHTVASSPEDIVFADQGLEDMYDGNYVVFTQNQTDVADPGTATGKSATQFTLTGPDAADVVDIVIIGRLKGQLA